MRIYLLRHAIAEEGIGKPDSQRAITSEGIDNLREVMRVAAHAGIEPTLVLSSPYRRAIETARIAIEVLKYKGPLVESKALTPDSSPRAAWEDVRIHSAEEAVLLVGHEPLFSALAAFMLGQPNLMIDFKKAGLLCVNVAVAKPHPAGVLEWYVTPKVARR